MILKEDWPQWQFIDEPDKMAEYKAERRVRIQAQENNEKARNGSFVSDFDFMGHSDEVKKNMEKANRINESERCNLFNVVMYLKMCQISRLYSNWGTAPTISLELFEIKDDDEQEPYSVQLQFSGDLEREQFIESLWHTSLLDHNDEDYAQMKLN